MNRRHWTTLSSLVLLSQTLLLPWPGRAWGVTLDRAGKKEGIDCPFTLKEAKENIIGGRSYVFEGRCHLPEPQRLTTPGAAVSTIYFRTYASYKASQDAAETMIVDTVTPTRLSSNLKSHGKATKCTRDPFVHGQWYCQGEKFFSTNVPLNYAPVAGGTLFFSAKVPANQVYTKIKPPPTPPLVPEQGAVRISSPTQNQRIPIAWPAFELRFEDNPTHNIDPDGGVKLEWKRFLNGQWVSHLGPPTHVEHWKMTQMVSIKNSFPNTGKYRVRAMASPLMQWSLWREFSIVTLDPLQAPPIKP